MRDNANMVSKVAEEFGHSVMLAKVRNVKTA